MAGTWSCHRLCHSLPGEVGGAWVVGNICITSSAFSIIKPMFCDKHVSERESKQPCIILCSQSGDLPTAGMQIGLGLGLIITTITIIEY